MTTSDLISALAHADADPATWAALVDRHGTRLWAVCVAAVGRDHADDAFQEGLIAIRQSAGRFRPGADAEASALAWMVTVMHCRAVNLLRREMRKAKREGHAMSDAVPASITHGSHDDQEQTAKLALRALGQLPERHQQVIRLRLLGGLDTAQTAAALGCPAEQVRVRLHRALEVLRRRCAPLLGAAMPSVPGLEAAIHQAMTPPAALPVAAQAKAMAAFSAPMTAAAGVSSGAVIAYAALGGGAVAAALVAAVAFHNFAPRGAPMDPPPPAATPPVASATRATPAAPGAVTAWRAKIDEQLKQQCTLDFADTDLSDVTSFLQRITSLTVVTEPRVMGSSPIPVTLKVEHMTLRHILDIIMIFQGMTGTEREGGLYLSGAHGATPGLEADTTTPAADQAKAETAWRQAIADHLRQKLTLDFEGTAFSDGISFVREVSQVNLVLAPGIISDDVSTQLTLKMRDSSVQAVLDAMMQQTKLAYVVRDEAIIIYQPANVPDGLAPAIPKGVSSIAPAPDATVTATPGVDRKGNRVDL